MWDAHQRLKVEGRRLKENQESVVRNQATEHLPTPGGRDTGRGMILISDL